MTTSGPDRQRDIRGVPVTAEVVSCLLASLGFVCLVVAAVLSWLERTT